LDKIEKEDDWTYYCKQEVIYSGTQLDESGNPKNSTPTWITLNI